MPEKPIAIAMATIDEVQPDFNDTWDFKVSFTLPAAKAREVVKRFLTDPFALCFNIEIHERDDKLVYEEET